jgi:Arc/MetJ-type ribon-helix-helix transcriptional regulator
MLKVSFAEIDEAYLRNKVDSGYYSSISEAVRDMVRKQREIDQSRLLSALEVGEQAILDGHVVDYRSDLFGTTALKGIAAAKRGDIPWNPDVRPQ